MKDTIIIYCKNTEKSYEVPIGATLLEIYKLVGEPLPYRPMNAQVNNKTEDLTYACWRPKDIEFVDYTNLSGRVCRLYESFGNAYLRPFALLYPLESGA